MMVGALRAHTLRAVRQFAWLEAGSGKVALSRPAHAVRPIDQPTDQPFPPALLFSCQSCSASRFFWRALQIEEGLCLYSRIAHPLP
jgi:hypothetical protein